MMRSSWGCAKQCGKNSSSADAAIYLYFSGLLRSGPAEYWHKKLDGEGRCRHGRGHVVTLALCVFHIASAACG